MSISAGIVRAVALQKVDDTPDAKTGTERDDEGLEYADSRVEKCHSDCLPESLGWVAQKSRFNCKSRNENCDAAPDSGVSFQFLFNFNDPFRPCKRGGVF